MAGLCKAHCLVDRLPDELILYVLRFLDAQTLAVVQLVSTRFLALARDDVTWQRLCFDSSRGAAALNLAQQSARLHAQTQWPELEELMGKRPARSRPIEYGAALANWDPAYPDEPHDFYEDYITRNARIRVSWFEDAKQSHNLDDEASEATGAALILVNDSHFALSTQPDGSISLRGLEQESQWPKARKSKPGLLTPGTKDAACRCMLMRSVTGPENISTAPDRSKAYFAVGDVLHEVDLDRLELVSSSIYPDRITALSAGHTGRPLVVGTNSTIHIHDPRDRTRYVFDNGWNVPTARHGLSPPYVTLEERGPLSILHALDDNDSIWIGGRFTSLLNYSLRFFPRLQSTIHSGARVSSMTVLPYPYEPPIKSDAIGDYATLVAQRASARARPGWTLVSAGEYKGKGSLELFDIARPSGSHTMTKYLNRQTAARSRLFAVASHCGKYVYADGDGWLKWVERDGSTAIREFDINTTTSTDKAETVRPTTYGPARPGAQASGPILLNDGVPLPAKNDIVQKIIPFSTYSPITRHSTEKLLLWSGDGRLGVLGFGAEPASAEEWHDAVEDQDETAHERANRLGEIQFQAAMRRALQRNADEVRFVRGLGMAGW